MSGSDAGARVVVFDGICHVCSGWVRFMARHRIEPPFKLIPMQTEEGKSLLVTHGIDPNDPRHSWCWTMAGSSRNPTRRFALSRRSVACGRYSR